MRLIRRYWFVTLFVIEICLVIAHYLWGKQSRMFDLDEERNLASLFSSVQLWFVATGAGIIAWLGGRIGWLRRVRIAWLGVTFLFGYLAIDELASLHEAIGAKINTAFHLFTSPSASFNWVLFLMPLEVVAISILLIVLIHTHRILPSVAKWFALGLGGMASVLLIEFLSGTFLYDSGRALGKGWWYWQSVVVEELVEMVAVTCMLVGVVRVLSFLVKKYIRINLEN